MTEPLTAHAPVMVSEVLHYLNAHPGGVYLDGTIGGAGHALEVLEASGPTGLLLGIDRDPAAVRRARRRCERFADRCNIVSGSFEDMGAIASTEGFRRFDGILLDLGFSSDQLGDPSRGFSFQTDGPLDMRLDPSSDTTAADLVNSLPETELADLLYRFGEERKSRRVAHAIVTARPIERTTQLAEVVARAVGGRRGRIHPATRTFQALRIAVNDELGAIERALPVAISLLRAGGRLVVISFHSLEDRVVKRSLREASVDCVCPPGLPECRCDHHASVSLPVRKAVRPTALEIRSNHRARSARLRVAERLADGLSAESGNAEKQP
jgi:16S rRNA (cytosine1402-N4)-methyltransferase